MCKFSTKINKFQFEFLLLVIIAKIYNFTPYLIHILYIKMRKGHTLSPLSSYGDSYRRPLNFLTCFTVLLVKLGCWRGFHHWKNHRRWTRRTCRCEKDIASNMEWFGEETTTTFLKSENRWTNGEGVCISGKTKQNETNKRKTWIINFQQRKLKSNTAYITESPKDSALLKIGDKRGETDKKSYNLFSSA